jgi:hypothetical protein
VFFKTIPRLYLSGTFSFVVTARLDTRIEWFWFTKCMLLLLMSLPESTLTCFKLRKAIFRDFFHFLPFLVDFLLNKRFSERGVNFLGRKGSLLL